MYDAVQCAATTFFFTACNRLHSTTQFPAVYFAKVFDCLLRALPLACALHDSCLSFGHRPTAAAGQMLQGFAMALMPSMHRQSLLVQQL
jgi:hypothetical protein